eukprot:jgi/Psemu1/67533/estExt_Genemark1.C_3340034
MPSNNNTKHRFASSDALFQKLLLMLALASVSILLQISLYMSKDCDSDGGGSLSMFSSSRSSSGKSLQNGPMYLDEADPKYTGSLNHPTDPDAPYDLVHSVLTRFMVGQGPKEGTSNKYELTKAHFHLFKTFTWPSIKFQTRQNFFWIVLMDPSLDKGIINDTKELMSKKHFPEENAYLVMTDNIKWSEDGVGVPSADRNGIGIPPIAEAFKNGNIEILTGNKDYLLRVLDMVEGTEKQKPAATNADAEPKSAPNKPIMFIETNLDADDALHNSGVEWTQKTALEQSIYQRKEQLKANPNARIDLESTWWWLCGEDYIEWHNREVYRISADDFSSVGISSGLVGLRRKPHYCRSSGFSRVGITTRGTEKEFPREAHHNHSYMYVFAQCKAPPPTDVVEENFNRCWRREYRLEESAFSVNGRAITSDSMDHMNPDDPSDYVDLTHIPKDEQSSLLIKMAERYWKSLQIDFSVDRTRAWETSVYLFQNRRSIIQQNRESKCVPGWPCHPPADIYQTKLEEHWSRQEQAAAAAAAAAAS